MLEGKSGLPPGNAATIFNRAIGLEAGASRMILENAPAWEVSRPMTPTRIVLLAWVFSDCAKVIDGRPRRRIARVKWTVEATVEFETMFETNEREKRMASSVQTPETGRIETGW